MIVSRKDEKLVKPDDDDINIGQDLEMDFGDQDDRYSISVVENPLYAEHENVVSYHKAGPDEDGEEEEVKVS